MFYQMYKKTQFGWIFFWTIMPLVAFFCILTIVKKEEMGNETVLPLILLLVILLLFKDLTITVDETNINIKFGIGLVQKNILLDEIAACEKVRNSWLMGWGIRFGFGYTLYNISGFDSVEVTFKDGRRKIRIGTGDQDALFDAINSRIALEP